MDNYFYVGIAIMAVLIVFRDYLTDYCNNMYAHIGLNKMLDDTGYMSKALFLFLMSETIRIIIISLGLACCVVGVYEIYLYFAR